MNVQKQQQAYKFKRVSRTRFKEYMSKHRIHQNEPQQRGLTRVHKPNENAYARNEMEKKNWR